MDGVSDCVGEVSVKVSAEAINAGHCGKGHTTVPKMGRIDTVVRTFLVEVSCCSINVVGSSPYELKDVKIECLYL